MTSVALPKGNSASWGSTRYKVVRDQLFTPQGLTVVQKFPAAPTVVHRPRVAVTSNEEVTTSGNLALTHNPQVTGALSRETRQKDLLKWLLSDSADASQAREDACLEVRKETRACASLLIDSLRDNHIAPSIMSDGEQDLILFWGNPAVFMVTVEGRILHPILKPGQSEAQYFESEAVDRKVPDWIIMKVPTIEHSALSSL
jgi:hypothetical protein